MDGDTVAERIPDRVEEPSEESAIVQSAEPIVVQSEEPEIVQSAEPNVVQSEEPEIVRNEEPEIVRNEEPEIVQSEEPEVVQGEEPEVVQSEEPEVVQSEEPEVVQSEESSAAKGQDEAVTVEDVTVRDTDELRQEIALSQAREVIDGSEEAPQETAPSRVVELAVESEGRQESPPGEVRTLRQVVAEAIGAEALEMLAMDTSESARAEGGNVSSVILPDGVTLTEGTIIADGEQHIIIIQHEDMDTADIVRVEGVTEADAVNQVIHMGTSSSIPEESIAEAARDAAAVIVSTDSHLTSEPSVEHEPITATEVALNVLPEDDDMEYDMDEPALLLTDKGKLYICIYCGSVSVFVSQLRAHLKTCRLKNPEPALEIPTLETILCRINDKLKRIAKGGNVASIRNGSMDPDRDENELKERIIGGIVDRAIECILRKSEKKKRSCAYCARIFYSQNSLRRHMEEHCDLRPSSSDESESEAELPGESTGGGGNLESEVPCMPLTVLPLGEPCACDHREEFTRAAGMLIEKLLKKANEVYFQGSCGNIFKVVAGSMRSQNAQTRESKVSDGKRSAETENEESEDEVDENGQPCGKFPCPLCKVVLQEAGKLDEHLMGHMAETTSSECDLCGGVIATSELQGTEGWS